MKRKQKNNIKLDNNKILYLAISVIVLFSLLMSKTLSKYVIEKQSNPIAQESTEFYFESEFADVEIKEYKNNYWDGENFKNIEIDLRNYFNNLLISNEQIKYQIKAEIIDDLSDGIIDSDLIDIKILNKNDEEINNNQELIFDSTVIEEKYILKIIPKTTLEANKKFNIKLTITSKEPYEKNLLAKVEIIIDKKENISNLIASENGEYVTLNLDIKNLEKDITIKFDSAKLQLDKSNYLVNQVATAKENNIEKFIISKENLEKINYEIYFIKLVNEDIILGTDIIVE